MHVRILLEINNGAGKIIYSTLVVGLDAHSKDVNLKQTSIHFTSWKCVKRTCIKFP